MKPITSLFIAAAILSLLASPCLAAKNGPDLSDARISDPDDADAKAAADADNDDADRDEHDTSKRNIDWATVESTGILSSAKGGALEKTLWAGQKRSDITKLLKDLPTGQKMRSALALQRRLLLSKTDAKLIDNDVAPGAENDLLVIRIEKLMDMGLYDDAWSLYAEKSENPYDAGIARLGMLLLVMRDDLPTACLEEKVLKTRFPDDDFFADLDRACAVEMGLKKTVKFEKSKVLDAIYNEATYSVPASNPKMITQMSDLERALLIANGKIRYDGLTPDILKKTDPAILSLYLMDKKITEQAKAMVKTETDSRGLSRYLWAAGGDETWKKAKNLGKDLDSQWPLVEQALNEGRKPYDLAAYVPMLAVAKPAAVTDKTLSNALAAFLAANRPLTPFWVAEAKKHAVEKPIYFLYLRAFGTLTSTKIADDDKGSDDALKVLSDTDRKTFEGVLAVFDKGNLDNSTQDETYDKQSSLTPDSNYVMHSGENDDKAEDAADGKHIGITILEALNDLADMSDNMYSESLEKTLRRLLTIGLIEDARSIGADAVAAVLNKY